MWYLIVIIMSDWYKKIKVFNPLHNNNVTWSVLITEKFQSHDDSAFLIDDRDRGNSTFMIHSGRRVSRSKLSNNNNNINNRSCFHDLTVNDENRSTIFETDDNLTFFLRKTSPRRYTFNDLPVDVARFRWRPCCLIIYCY